MDKFKKYDKKCVFFRLRFRQGKDDKYIEFLRKCPNKMEFIRQAIEQELQKKYT